MCADAVPIETHGLSVSVALCTHNGARFIREQIRSICFQRLPVDEIVISDDASVDDCVALARAALAECVRNRLGLKICLRVLQNRSALGVTRNFEQAILACRNPLIALSDQDDLWHQDRTARMVSRFEDDPELLLLHSDARLIDAKGADMGDTLFGALGARPREIMGIHGDGALDVMLRRNLVAGATVMFRRSLLEHAMPFPVEWLHDEWLATVAALRGGLDVVEQPLIDYRQHHSNQIGVSRMTLRKGVARLFAKRGDIYAKRVEKIEVLLQRILRDELKADAVDISKVEQKLAHQKFRAGLPASRLFRIFPILKEIKSGRYDRYGIARYNILRDILERV